VDGVFLTKWFLGRHSVSCHAHQAELADADLFSLVALRRMHLDVVALLIFSRRYYDCRGHDTVL